ncbi:MAG: ABC transporter substrate-binding protein [Oscillospiraceae bacterium]
MKSTFTKAVSLLLALVMVLSFAACNKTEGNGDNPSNTAEPDTYTYKAYSTALGTNWNDHTWETNADDTILGYVSSPFCTMSILDSENGVYQWIWEMATSITDVTADHQDDLTKYNVTLPEGQSVEDTKDGYVWEIALNPKAKWENGEIINADSYIYSMQQLLNPEMKNYRANLYIGGESAIAGGEAYYYAGDTAYIDTKGAYALEDLVLGEDGNYTTADGNALFVALSSGLEWLGGNTLSDYVGAYPDYFDVEAFDALSAVADENGKVALNDETLALIQAVISVEAWGEGPEYAGNYLLEAKSYPEANFDNVGLYKVDDYTIRYVTQSRQDYNYFLTSCTSTWLVYEDLYEAGKDTSGTLVTTNYCTSKETTMSYGPYKIESLQDGKQIVFVQNPEWFGYEKQEDGSLLSMTNFEVDGESVQQYKTTKIVIDVMDEAAAKQAFLKGELSEWTPSADDLLTYSTSDALYKIDETYTMSFFFNCGLEALQEMDRSKGNTNSVVLSNYNFRKAMSLAIDRAEYVTATTGYKPAYAIMNNLYFYDVYNDPTSSYRNSEPAMQAICNLYGVEYGEGKAYATLEEAYKSINGYNLTEAKELMKQACQELVEAGLYTEGEDIYVRIGWAKGALESDDNNCVELLNKFVNAALEGSGFGKITFEAVGNINDRYGDTANGEYAIGYGAWGGAAFYPFRNFQVYCDPDNTAIHEAGCWDPTTETLTINVNGEDVTMTWQAWSNALIGSGPYAAADNQTKLEITAKMEEEFLKKYYRIPLAGTTACFMLSYQCSYYTENYNIMYDFGGLRLMQYNYTDAEWAAFVAEQGGTIAYE